MASHAADLKAMRQVTSALRRANAELRSVLANLNAATERHIAGIYKTKRPADILDLEAALAAARRMDPVLEPTPIDDADLCAMEARERAATPGPWRWWTSNSQRRLSSDVTGGDGDVACATVHPRDRVPDIQIREADARFIEHARTDMQRLIVEVRRLRALLAKEEGRFDG